MGVAPKPPLLIKNSVTAKVHAYAQWCRTRGNFDGCVLYLSNKDFWQLEKEIRDPKLYKDADLIYEYFDIYKLYTPVVLRIKRQTHLQLVRRESSTDLIQNKETLDENHNPH